MSQRWYTYSIILASFVVALLLFVYPLPLWLRWWRPEFVLLVAIYWISVFPLTMSLIFLCLVGLFQDLLDADPLGQHALSLVIVAYICMASYQRVQNFALWKESGWVFVLVGLSLLTNNWVQGYTGRPVTGLAFLAPALTSALLWPLYRLGLDRLRNYYRIS